MLLFSVLVLSVSVYQSIAVTLTVMGTVSCGGLPLSYNVKLERWIDFAQYVHMDSQDVPEGGTFLLSGDKGNTTWESGFILNFHIRRSSNDAAVKKRCVQDAVRLVPVKLSYNQDETVDIGNLNLRSVKYSP